jgi:hypothetical protein
LDAEAGYDRIDSSSDKEENAMREGPQTGTESRPVGHAKTQSRFHPPTLKQKATLASGLIVGTILIVALWTWCVMQVDHHLRNETRVAWSAPDSFVPQSGPPSFWYDSEHHQLAFVGTIDAKQKSDLLALFPVEVADRPPVQFAAYRASIDALAYKSNQNLFGALIAWLFLGGLSGTMGAQLRSITAFVGNACFTQKLDITTWWPYYLLRPFTGFILGIVVVVIVQAGFLAVGSGSSTGTLWWVSVAILAGYSDDEFTQKLRQLSKTIFGEKDFVSKDDEFRQLIEQNPARDNSRETAPSEQKEKPRSDDPSTTK